MKPRAFVLLRHAPDFRSACFKQGLESAGFDVHQRPPDRVARGDLLVIWNRYGDSHALALRVEAAGGTVLVAENGYIGQATTKHPCGTAPKFDLDGGMQPGHYIALAVGGHNGAGRVPQGDGARWAALGIEVQPWRTQGKHILVCPNRSFGTPGRIQPVDWAAGVCARLHKATRREVRLRGHPGTHAPKRPLAADLADCWAVVIWHSSAGLHALVAGVPVICEAPAWSCMEAAGCDLAQIEAPPMPARLPALERLAWAQWTFAEIASGEPFRRLLNIEQRSA